MPRAIAGLLTIVCGVLLAPAVASAQTETIEFFALDTVGSVRVVFDQNGNVVKRADYEPFGAPVAQPPLPNEDIYAGLWRDEAGLDYAQARMYQRSTGRFNAPDPIKAGLSNPQRWNGYTYALNSPLAYSDATGLLANSNVPSSLCGAEHSFGSCGGQELFGEPQAASALSSGEAMRTRSAQGTSVECRQMCGRGSTISTCEPAPHFQKRYRAEARLSPVYPPRNRSLSEQALHLATQATT